MKLRKGGLDVTFLVASDIHIGFSENWFTTNRLDDAFGLAIHERRVIGIFHYQATGGYRWRGFDVYDVGSPKYVHHSFATVGIADIGMTVVERDYDRKRYSWWHKKHIHSPEEGTPFTETMGADPLSK